MTKRPRTEHLAPPAAKRPRRKTPGPGDDLDALVAVDAFSEEQAARQGIARILDRLDAEIPEAQKRMDALLARLRTSRIAA
jgi:hypothetical protein